MADYLGQDKVNDQCLSDEEIMILVNYGIKIEEMYGAHQDIEWGFDRDTKKLYILQSRPITTLKGDVSVSEVKEQKELKMLVRGLPASPELVEEMLEILKIYLKLEE